MKLLRLRLAVWMVLGVFFTKNAIAFGDSTVTKTVNTTILLPLYLDSMFKSGGYGYGNTIPKFALPALEFYNGVQLAADSLEKEGIKVRIEVVDSRKYGAVGQLFSPYNVHKPGVVIGVMQNGTELKQVSGLSNTSKIPFISATYPNDGGVSANPGLLIANSTLKTHCFALYQYLLRNRSKENIVLFSRMSGPAERIKGYLKEAENSSTAGKLKWKMVSLPDSFTVNQVAFYLDSVQSNTVIGGSMDDEFSLKLIRTVATLKTDYQTTVFGMPTWDEYNLTKPEFRGIDVYFSTPFVSHFSNAALYTSLSQKFKSVANSRPSDMVFKGYEITYRYVKTLSEHPDDFLSHVNDSHYRVFVDFDFEPVTSQPGAAVADYLENKKIYFVKKTDGAVKGVY